MHGYDYYEEMKSLSRVCYYSIIYINNVIVVIDFRLTHAEDATTAVAGEESSLFLFIMISYMLVVDRGRYYDTSQEIMRRIRRLLLYFFVSIRTRTIVDRAMLT